MKQQIKQVLLSTPFEKRLTTAQIILLLKVPVAGSLVTNTCLELIEEKEIGLLHVFEVGKWRYLRSKNSKVIAKHNRHLRNKQELQNHRKYCL